MEERMSTPLASTTVLHGMSKRDVAVQVGTTVASLMRMLEIDPTSMTLAHPDATTQLSRETASGGPYPAGDQLHATSAEASNSSRSSSFIPAARDVFARICAAFFVSFVAIMYSFAQREKYFH